MICILAQLIRVAVEVYEWVDALFCVCLVAVFCDLGSVERTMDEIREEG